MYATYSTYSMFRSVYGLAANRALLAARTYLAFGEKTPAIARWVAGAARGLTPHQVRESL